MEADVKRGNHLDPVLGVVATFVHVKAGVHAAAEVSSLWDGAGHRQVDQRRIMNTPFILGPFASGFNGMRPELEHPSGNESKQHQGEQGDVVDPMLGLHPGDKSWSPGAVFPPGIHVSPLHVVQPLYGQTVIGTSDRCLITQQNISPDSG